MRIFSDKTGKEYATVQECQTDEAAYDQKLAEAKQRADQLAANRQARHDEVANAYKEVQAAEEKYMKLRDQYINDYEDDTYKSFINLFFKL